MSDLSAEDVQIVREALPNTASTAPADPHAALTRLEARLAATTAEATGFRAEAEAQQTRFFEALARAEAAEARLAEVERERDEAGMLPEEGLERIASLACDLLAALRPWEMHGPTVRSSAARLTIALAALPLQAAPKQDEAEGEK